MARLPTSDRVPDVQDRAHALVISGKAPGLIRAPGQSIMWTPAPVFCMSGIKFCFVNPGEGCSRVKNIITFTKH